MQDIFRRFADQLAESVNANDLHVALAEAASSIGLSWFAYLFPRSGRATRLISTYPQTWTSRYLESRYDVLDPVICRARILRTTFCWNREGCGSVLSAPQRRLMEEAREFGIRFGFTIPLRDGRGQFAALTFAGDERQPQLFRVVEQNERALQLVAAFFHIHARRILVTERATNEFGLSRREDECLRWAGRGKSAWDIGCILGITPRTVAFHLENAKKKMGVRTTIQAAILLALSKSSDFPP